MRVRAQFRVMRSRYSRKWGALLGNRASCQDYAAVLILDSQLGPLSQGLMHLGETVIVLQKGWSYATLKPPGSQIGLSHQTRSRMEGTGQKLNVVHVCALPLLSVGFGLSHLTFRIPHFSSVK